jgi:gliding motility-associated-like protein
LGRFLHLHFRYVTCMLLFGILFTIRVVSQTADFTINISSGCVPLGGVNFTDVSTGGTVLSRDWDLGNGVLIPNGAVTVGTNYLIANTYNVKLTVYFSGGITRTATKQVVVHPKPVADFSVSDTAGCAPHTANFQDLSTTATGTITNWQWDFGAGGSTLQNPSFVYNSNGLYNISLIVTNSWGCTSDAATKFQYIRVYTRPTPSFTATPFFGCKDTLTVNFNNTTTGGSPSNTWLWNFGDGNTSTVKNPTHFYAAPGTYTVTLTASVGNNCSATTTRTVYVGNVSPFFITAPDTVCINVPTLFSGSATPAPASVKWIFSDNNAIQFGSPTTHSFANPGDYTITFIAFTAQGCSDTITRPIHVKSGAGLTPFFIIAPDTVCVNNPTLFSGSATPAPASIRWYFADNNAIQNGSPTTHSFSPAGNHQVSLYVYDSKGCADTISKTVHAKTGPVASFIPDKLNGCGVPFTVTFTNTTPGNNLRFTWNFGDGSPLLVVNDALPVSHTYTTFGNFTVTLTAQDTLVGCAGATTSVLIRNYLPNVNFTYVPPNGCKPLPVFFTAQVSNLIVPGIKYVWNYGDGSLPDTLLTPTTFHLYTLAGVFPVTLTIVTPECVYTVGPKPVTVVDICDDDGSGGGGGGGAGFLVGKNCTNKYTVTLTDTVTGNRVTEAWDFGDGSPWYTTPPLNPVTHTYSPPQKEYIVSIARLDTVTGIRDTASKRVIIIDEKANFVPDRTDICSNRTVNFATIGIDSSKISLYTWNFGDGTAPQVINNTLYYNLFGLYLNGNTSHTYTDTGLFYVKLTITDKLGCRDSFMFPVPIRVSAPAAVFGADVQLSCLVPLKVIFTDSSRQNGSNVIVNRQWNFGDGSPIYNTTVDTPIVHLYTPNTYTVRLTVTDAIGCTGTTTRTVVVPVVATGPRAGFVAAPLTSCSSPHTVTFTDTSIRGGGIPIKEWRWTFGDGSPVLINTADTPVNHIYTGNSFYNVYNVTLRVKDSIGCESTITKPAYIKLYKPKANFFSFDTLKCGSYNVFIYNTSNAFNATYTWYYGDGSSSTGFYGVHTYATEGEYDIKLVVRDENGCMDSITKTSYIKLVRPKADFKVGDTTKCAPAAIIFTDSSKYATAWQWDFGDGGTGSTAQNPAPKIYPLPGFYRVKLTVTGLNGCVDSTFKWIRVRGPIATLQAPSLTGCKPLTFNARVQGSFINTYAWDFGDGTPVNPSTTDSIVSHVYLKAGKYLPNVVLVSPEGCPYTLKATDTVIVDSAKAYFSPLTSVFCGTGTVAFTNLSKTPAFSSFTNYAWNFGDGSPVDINATPAPHVYGPGNYNVSLAVKSFYGCVDTFIQPLAVVVHPLPRAGITGDSIRCTPGTYQYNSNVVSPDPIRDYEWKVNGVPVGISPNLNYNFTAGNYVIGLKVTTENNCTDEIQRNIIIDSVKAAFSVINPVRCANDLNVTFNNLSGSQFGISNYLWDFGDNTTSTAQNPPTHVYPGYGSYNVSLYVKSVHGCEDSVKIVPAVVLSPLPAADITGDSIRCKPGTYQYNSSIVSLDPIQEYEWRINGVVVGNSQNMNYNFNAGNYTIGLKVKTNKGCTDEVQRSIIIDSVKAAFSVVNPVRCADDLNVNFINNSGGKFGISNYLWNFGDNTTATVQNPPAHTYPGYGNYNVSLYIQSVHGCEDSMKIVPAVVINPLPAAGISGDSIHCKPGIHSYGSNIISIDPVQSYEWKVDGALVSVNQNLNYNFAAGNHIVGLKVRTNNNCTDEVQRSIIVDSVKANFSIVRPVRCGNSDLTVDFTNLSGGRFAIASYEWSFGDGQTSTAVNPTHTYPSTGSYSIQLIVRSVHGCTDTLRMPNAVVIYPGPSVAINGIAEKCMRSTILFTSQVVSQDVITGYLWRVNNIAAGTTDTLNYYFATAGNYNVTLEVSTQNGCTVLQTKGVTIRPLPVPAAAPSTTVCEGTQVNLQAQDGVSYVWAPAATLQNPNTATPTALPLQDTRYYVTVTNQWGCVQTDSILVRVDRKVNLQTPPDKVTCRGTAVTLTASGNASQFIWSPLTGLSNPNSAVTQANPDTTTTYRIIGVSNNVCKSDTGYVKVIVGDIPTVNLGPDLSVEAGRNITLTPITTGGVTNYAWSPATGLSCVSCATPVFVADKNITYRLRVTTQYGCTATDDVNVVVTCGKGAVYIPGGFTPNNDGVNDYFFVSGYGIANVKVFSVFDRWGKRVFHKENIQPGNASLGWDGRVGGKEVTTSTTFVYVAEVTCAEGKTFLLKGTVILMR